MPHLQGFNEAAGIPRGRRDGPGPAGLVRRASMRPRVFPADDHRGWSSAMQGGQSFNEAAGIPRGRPRSSRRRSPKRVWRFNEAAGIPRGRQAEREANNERVAIASMRPRVFPAEDSGGEIVIDSRLDASMRPRVFPAEDVVWDGDRVVVDDASMRPRVFPAEDDRVSSKTCEHITASMRPRVFPAEDVSPCGPRTLTTSALLQ